MAKKKLPEYKIVKKLLSDLKDNPDNPRTIERKNLEGLAKSLETFGLLEPIIWNKRTGYIVGGHQRKKALEAAGYEEAQVLVVDFPAEKEIQAVFTMNNQEIQGQFDKRAMPLLAEIQKADSVLMADLRLDALMDSFGELSKPKEKPEVEFTQELLEEHNYVVLTFRNKPDWLYLQSLFPLETVKALDSKPGFEKRGVGRVVDGVKFLRTVRNAE